MIDNVGGPQRMNNCLTTLDLPPINNRSLKVMERRAGKLIENFADENMKAESKRAYEKEMSEIFQSEQQAFEEEICDLGVAVIEDEFIGEPLGSTPQSEALPEIHHCRKRRPETISVAETAKKRRLNFLPRTPTGITVCADHAWQKRGFDSLTGHTYLLSKENKVLKIVVKHRTCRVCKCWRRRRPGQKLRHHRCVLNHKGSSRLMESEAGVEAVKEMNDQGTPIAVIEGDGDNTLIARLKSNLGLTAFAKGGLSPGHYNIKYSEKLDKNRELRRVKMRQPDVKCRRLILKQEQATQKGAYEASEGSSYQSVKQGIMPHITQIAAVEMHSGNQFTCYVLPKVLIKASAEKVTGIVFDGTDLFVNGRKVDALIISDAIGKLLEWLGQLFLLHIMEGFLTSE
ncbi:hypothetical protein FSP39_020887 [Pinctada imbricata]|uniref:Mutator-like transposase domain-containing protein n=1 Tax=Pinctada imbricata TaxID=66713 RepID=A0AA89C4B0_PINIB|nr:hypothetical protein FSP39_020887 [Pinctada imbricata]